MSGNELQATSGYVKLKMTLRSDGNRDLTCAFCDRYPMVRYESDQHEAIYRALREHQRNECTDEARANAGDRQIMPPRPRDT